MEYIPAQEYNTQEEKDKRELKATLNEIPEIAYIRLKHPERESIVSFYSSKFKFIMPFFNEFGKRCNKFVKNTFNN